MNNIIKIITSYLDNYDEIIMVNNNETNIKHLAGKITKYNTKNKIKELKYFVDNDEEVKKITEILDDNKNNIKKIELDIGTDVSNIIYIDRLYDLLNLYDCYIEINAPDHIFKYIYYSSNDFKFKLTNKKNNNKIEYSRSKKEKN